MLIQQYLLSGENNMFEAVFTNRKYKYDQWITLKSTSTRETVNLISNDKYDMRAQTVFWLKTVAKSVCKSMRGVKSQNVLPRSEIVRIRTNYQLTLVVY